MDIMVRKKERSSDVPFAMEEPPFTRKSKFEVYGEEMIEKGVEEYESLPIPLTRVRKKVRETRALRLKRKLLGVPLQGKAENILWISLPQVLLEYMSPRFSGLRNKKLVMPDTKCTHRRTHYIPDVCHDLGIPCINLLGLI